jgi:hypothetical protein
VGTGPTPQEAMSTGCESAQAEVLFAKQSVADATAGQ